MDQIILTEEALEAMLDRAAKRGAREALKEIGLHDEDAHNDIKDLRGLLTSFRTTRKTIWQTMVTMGTTALIGFIGLAVWASVKVKIGSQ